MSIALVGEVVSLEPPLPDLASLANQEHALARQSGEAMIDHAIRAGEALEAAKAQVAHGEWLPWLKDHCEFSERTARGYMHVASNRQRVADLPEPSLRKALSAISGGGASVLREAKAPISPVGTFATIVADPPWQYDNKATRGAAEDHYPTMSVEELCGLPVNDWVAEQAHLYLWTTNGFLREAFDVLAAWGFTYKTTLVWVKPQIGMGNYFRSSTEYVLFGVRGGLRTRDCNQRNWFESPRAKHSAKPGMFFDVVERASYPPYLEMFARQRRLNPEWGYWGNEA